MKILFTRCHPPSQDVMLIPRAISEELRSQFLQPKVIVVKAPAGYGKTTMMVQMYREALDEWGRLFWLSLDEFDGSWKEAWRYLWHVLKGTCTSLAGISPDGYSEEEAEAALCNALSTANPPVGVFLDDVHTVRGTEAERFIGRLLKRTLGTTLWVIGSRSEPSFPISKWRSSGLLVEVDVETLRFTNEEVSRILSLSSRSGVTDRLIESAYARTEGWPAGMKLISIALSRTHDEQAFIERLSGANRGVAAFFYEEVFARLEPDMQSFLLRTAMLGRVCPDLCDSVLHRVDSRAMLRAIEAMGLFIFSLDDVRHWYRYHSLFAEFLLQLLRECEDGVAIESRHHRQASEWFAKEQLIPEAIQHAFRGGDPRRAAELLEESWAKLYDYGLFATAEKWVAEISPEILREFPSLLLWRALYLMCERRLDEARGLLFAVSERLKSIESRDEADGTRQLNLRHQLLHKQLILAQFSDDIASAERAYRALTNENVCFDPVTKCSTDSALIFTRREQFNLQQLEEISARVRTQNRAENNPAALLWHVSVIGPALVMQGRTDAAMAMYRSAITMAESMASDSSDLRAMPMLLLADLLTERGAKVEAKALFEKAESLGSGVGTVDHLIALHVTQARLAFLLGDTAKSDELLATGFSEAVAKSYERLRLSVVHERIRQALCRRNLDMARQIARDMNFVLAADDVRPISAVNTRTELNAMIWSRVAIASGQYSEAIGLLRQWLSFFGSRGVVESQIRFGLLLARAYHMSGDTRASIRSLRDAVRHASVSGTVFSFLEEGDPIRSLLSHVVEWDEDDESLATAIRGFQLRYDSLELLVAQPAKTTVGAHKHRSDDGPCEPLSSREIEILSFVSCSFLNKEIADKLGLTEGSVKWYMQQIYGKLGVRRRMAALDKARVLGYLS